MPVQRATEQCGWLKQMVDAGAIFHPLRWTPSEALQLLKDAPALEHAGVVVRMPATWRMGRPTRPQVKATIGDKPPGKLGLDALLDFHMDVTLDGETLTPAEISRLLAQSEGLVHDPRQVGGRRSRATHPHARAVPGGRAARRRRGPAVRGSDAPPSRSRHRRGGRRRPGRYRVERDRRRPMARRDARCHAASGRARAHRPRARAPGQPAALSAGGRAVAAPAGAPAPRRLPRRRHGPRQDHPVLSLLLALKRRSSASPRASAPSWCILRQCWTDREGTAQGICPA
jgi:SNF2 Helicase protein